MATKRGRRSGAKKSKPGTKKAASAPHARGGIAPRGTMTAAPRGAARPTAAGRPARDGAAAGPSLLEQAERLRDAIQRSKLTAADPWAYTAKARGWGQRAQQLVDQLALRGESAGLRGAVEALAAEVERDRDFQEARRLF